MAWHSSGWLGPNRDLRQTLRRFEWTWARMSSGSYRGGSTLTGWNANGYLSGSGRGLSRKQRLKALSTKTAQTPTESADQDDAVRQRHGLRPQKPKPPPKVEPPTKSELNAKQRRLTRTSAPVVVVKLKSRKAAATKAPKRFVSRPTGLGRKV